jgi:XapX domain-containing protein
VDVIFAIFGLKPPSPDNIIGIMGIVGIFLGWVIMGYYFR